MVKTLDELLAEADLREHKVTSRLASTTQDMGSLRRLLAQIKEIVATPDAEDEGDAVDDGGLLDIDLMSLAEEYLAGLRQDQKAGAACLVPIEVWSKAIAAARAQHARRQEECTECCHEWEVGLAEAARAQVEAESENERLRKEREGERVVGVVLAGAGPQNWLDIDGHRYFLPPDVAEALGRGKHAIRRVEEPKAKAKILRPLRLPSRSLVCMSCEIKHGPELTACQEHTCPQFGKPWGEPRDLPGGDDE